MALCDRLGDRGATIVGPASNLEQATELADETPFDVAVLDVDLAGVYSYPLARSLRARAIPIVLMTGYDSRTIPDDLRDLPLFDKLGSIDDLTRMLASLVHAG
jgi:DNA-binding NarL/FixJ family response regulator